MTTYNAAAVSDYVINYQKGITLQQGRALRDNPIAIAEADPSVSANLLPTVLLGTLNTTSGSVQTLSGISLGNYRFLELVVDGVSAALSGGFNVSLNGTLIFSFSVPGGANLTLKLELSTGKVLPFGSGSFISTTVNSSTTSLSFSLNSSSYSAGSIRIYGVK